MPAALVLLTPEIDLTESGDSFTTLAHVSVGLEPLREVNLLYANGHDLHDPYLSPLFGDLVGFPPHPGHLRHPGPVPVQRGPDTPQAARGRRRR
jgi:hypothetical protein